VTFIDEMLVVSALDCDKNETRTIFNDHIKIWLLLCEHWQKNYQRETSQKTCLFIMRIQKNRLTA